MSCGLCIFGFIVSKKTLFLPGARMMDAWGRMAPSKLLLGNVMWVGSFDECTNKWTGGKYCVTPVVINDAMSVVSINQTTPVFIAYGSCFPKMCSVGDVRQVMKIIPEVSCFYAFLLKSLKKKDQ